MYSFVIHPPLSLSQVKRCRIILIRVTKCYISNENIQMGLKVHQFDGQ